MLTIFQPVRYWINPNQLAKHCVMKSNLKLYDSSCIVNNGNTYSNQFVSYIAHARWTSPTKPKKLSPADHLRDIRKEADVAGHSFAMCDSSRRVPSVVNRELAIHNSSQDKITIAFLPDIQGDIISISRQGLIKCNNGFSNIFQHHLELRNMQKILKQDFVEQKQNIRTISTQTKVAQQKQAKSPPPQNSCPPSDFAKYSTDQLTRQQKLKRAVKEYGSTVMVFHVTISLISLGAFYVAVSSGIDMVSIMSHFGVGDKIQQSQLAAGASTFVVAYAIHKVFAPVRIGITLSATPLIVRYLRLKGILKPYKSPKQPQ